MDPILVGLAVAGGAAGKAVGNSPMTGEQPWGKLAGPALALLVPYLYRRFGGTGMTDQQVFEVSVSAASLAVGGYHTVKNLVQLVKGLFTKKIQ
jgi:hypothetical protein